MELCRGYKAGVKIEELPCGGCRFCVRMQDKWGKFEEEVDDVVPLAVREVGLEPRGWVENYTKEELRKVQPEDEIVGKVLRWLEFLKWEGLNVLGRVLMQLRNDLWREGGYRIW